MQHGVQTTLLDSGLRVITKSLNWPSAAASLVFPVGSGVEPVDNGGTAHFLEHMFFKGTTSMDRRTLEKEADQRGTFFNAYTTRENSCYFASGLGRDMPWALDTLNDLISHPLLRHEDIEREKGVIGREGEVVACNPHETLMDVAHARLFTGGMAATILGSRSAIGSQDADTLRRFRADNYTACNAVMAVAGGVDHEVVVSAGRKLEKLLFHELPRQEHVGRCSGVDIDSRLQYHVDREYVGGVEVSHVGGFMALPGLTTESAAAVAVAAELVGTTWTRGDPATHPASLFFPFAFEISPAHAYYRNKSLVGVRVTCASEDAEKVRDLLPLYFSSVATPAAFPGALQRVRTMINAVASSTFSIADALGRSAGGQDWLEKINDSDVSLSDVSRVLEGEVEVIELVEKPLARTFKCPPPGLEQSREMLQELQRSGSIISTPCDIGFGRLAKV